MVKTYLGKEIKVGDFLFGPIPTRKRYSEASIFLVYHVTPKTFAAWYKTPSEGYNFVWGLSRSRLYIHYPESEIPEDVKDALAYYLENNTFVEGDL